MNQGLYPDNWKQIATALKAASNWRCAKCGRTCLRPGEKPNHLNFSERKAYTLQVHHWNRDPSDNRLENLVCLYKVAVTFITTVLVEAMFLLGSCYCLESRKLVD